MNVQETDRSGLERSIPTTSGRAATWLAYGTILTGASAFASLPAAPATESNSGAVLRFERSTTMATSLTLAEQHSLEMRSLVLEVGDAEPEESPVKLHVWSGALSYVVDQIDPKTGLLCRRYDRSKGVIQSGRIDETGQEYRGPEMPLVSPLEDIGVAFTPKLDAPDGYARHYDSALSLNETLLPRLAAPRDWGALLPPVGENGQAQSVELGDEWSVAPAALICALSPTGNLLFEGSEGMEPRMFRVHSHGVGGNLHLGFLGDVDGAAKARFQLQGIDPLHGRFAEIEIEFELDLSTDPAKSIRGDRVTPVADGDVLGANLEQSFRGTVTLRWALDSNGPLSCVTACDESVLLAVQMSSPDGTLSRQTVSMDGSLDVSVIFDEVPLRRTARDQ